MYIIEVHRCREVRVCRACEEVQAAVTSQNCAGLCYKRSYRSVAQYIVISCAACQLAEISDRIFIIGGVDKVKFDSLLLSFLCREELSCAVQSLLIDVCYDDHSRTSVAVHSVTQSSETHRACACHDGKLAAFDDAHLMCVNAHLCVICCMESAYAAGVRLCQRSFIVSFSFVLKHTSEFHDFCRNDAIGSISAEELI